MQYLGGNKIKLSDVLGHVPRGAFEHAVHRPHAVVGLQRSRVIARSHRSGPVCQLHATLLQPLRQRCSVLHCNRRCAFEVLVRERQSLHSLIATTLIRRVQKSLCDHADVIRNVRVAAWPLRNLIAESRLRDDSNNTGRQS